MSIEIIALAGVSAFIGAMLRDWWLVGRHRRRAKYPPDWDDIRRNVYCAANYRCQNCHTGDRQLHAHHIVPLSLGGTNSLSNLACLCRDCHKKLHAHMA